jgi:K+/H+ antiporter YhaU regulatory subunit KhtT
MEKEVRIKVPRYKQIALDIASRIASGEFKEGSRVFGRSSLAGEYNVSPETIRRAIILLEDMQVVEATAGSGVVITSTKNAHKYMESYKSKESISSLRTEVISLLEKKKSIESEIMEIIDKIIDYSERLKNTNPMNPVEISLHDESHLIGRTISESKFWQNTGATIIGIRRGADVILSPGPYMEFEKGDKILAVGDAEIIERAKEFMKNS